jgi:hypothetical protein
LFPSEAARLRRSPGTPRLSSAHAPLGPPRRFLHVPRGGQKPVADQTLERFSIEAMTRLKSMVFNMRPLDLENVD